jgi:hypothetical protein
MNDLELIRQFRSHVEAPDPDRVAAARATLTADWENPVAKPRERALRRPALAAALAAAAIAAAAVLLNAGSLGAGASPADAAAIIHHADAALSARAHEILHTKVVGDGFVGETWQLTSPPYSYLAYKGPVGSPAPEEAGNATTSSYYDPASNTIQVQPSAPAPAFDDPLAEVRHALDAGQARYLGATQTDGVPTYKIQFADKNGFTSQGLIAYVDRHTYRPVLLSDPQRTGGIVQLRVETFEYLPPTAANLASLRLSARHPTARVVTDPASTKTPPASK